MPQGLAAAAVVVGLTGFHGALERLRVHVAVHEHLAGGVIGGHHRNESVLVELRRELHALLHLLDAFPDGKGRVPGCAHFEAFNSVSVK